MNSKIETPHDIISSMIQNSKAADGGRPHAVVIADAIISELEHQGYVILAPMAVQA